MRGAWIETICKMSIDHTRSSLPMRGAWIETLSMIRAERLITPSLPMRGAWIETSP